MAEESTGLAGPGDTVYAISVHDGGGSMAEGMEPTATFGFWRESAMAEQVAETLYRRLAVIDEDFRDNGLVIAIPIEIHTDMTAAMKDFIEEFRQERQ